MDLAADDAHHLARVVRRRPGDTVEVMDGAGAIWP
ncbi:MAG: RNA methyltransferase PUA domain-containing protein, partial [Thermoleophilia bacterium]